MSRKPALFIGSSVEGLEIAHTVQELLDFDCEATVWTQDVFRPSSSALADLYVRTRRTDLALFVFTPDDEVKIRGGAALAPRDNVVFELGLFMGALEPNRCFVLQPRGVAMHLPTDILGMTPLTYAADRNDRNLLAALGPACNQLRRAIREFETESTILKFSEDRRKAPPGGVRKTALQDYVREWEGPLKPARDALRDVTLDVMNEETVELRPQLRQLFGFLDGLAGEILDHTINEDEARTVFEQAVLRGWPHLALLLAPPNMADEYWNPPPRLAELYVRWRKATIDA
ncbi:MAG: hypothetical protein EON87_04925 [Brevundimonas sp.]|nr:MAG: hypothetical protein EON87_04925 [Brevundimonas sp.]